MPQKVATPGSWTDDERDRMLALLTQVDSVELKLSIPDADRRSTVAALDLDPLAADMVQVWFFDTPDLDLNGGGVIARARRTRKRDDATVKLRPVEPTSAFAVAAEPRTFLEERGIDLEGVQQTKTTVALRYFTGELRAEPDAAKEHD